MLFIVACAIKFMVTLAIADVISSLICSLFFLVFYSYLIWKKSDISSYILLVMIDYIFGYYLCISAYDINLQSLLFSLIYFVCGSGYMYFLIIDHVGKITSNKTLTNISNIEVDKGIKALENDDYNLALESFSNAIKEHKKNYLGYMGMCNTLTKMDKKNLKKLKYYKKKCIKYAPKELRNSINNKF